ncbi:probable LRR receptor-like serine/threonine-protein kinase At3g47570 isoform X1 [Corylus avellana]|uniref:probable LRR receptor-like serine/threonine-protein kinase At3g47570 isoform X1 n=1 Tax=Corylus avellana TaxID=13451 RepID=UPI00286A9A6D|nr:probable LRR receptor-like serine/threonine-protein kinase At3g47570 isoform X1 [Corylus avellana]
MMQTKTHSILLFLGFLLAQSCTFQLAHSSTNITDRSALIAFNSKIRSSSNETVLAGNWSTTTNFCNWIGVSCSRRRQRVTALNLSYMGLQGTISPHIEYGSEGKVSIKGDVYSYGIIMLEMITRKKPTDDMFVGELTLRKWINTSLPDKIMDVVDDGLLGIENGRDVTIMQSVLSSIMELGLRCSEELPDERVDIKDVLGKLQKIKLTLSENKNRGI